ncbi:MAG: flagellar M-ring protein FliF [Bdellovibrionaceae bacterium]|nr:flagellar M-ring protein FliF [Pseudobdellovibrionaceae bacterium]
MNKVIGNLVVQFKEFYKSLTPVKRVSVIMSAVIAMVATVIVSTMLTRTNYAMLLKDVPSDQLPLVVQKLKQNNIPFELDESGSLIKVPAHLLHSSQMVIMSQLGTSDIGNIGLELFEKQEFGTTSYAQRINYQRAMQGELIRAINSLASVKRSKVILALPAKKTFLEEGRAASASVVVELHPGKHLDRDQIRGIRNLVGSSVEDLRSENVTVLDHRGKVLTRSSDTASSESSELFEMQKRVEQNMEERIESILQKVVGAGKVIARVNVKLNPRKISSVEETVDPDRTAVRSSVAETESLAGRRTNPTGIPGARANLPGAQDQGQVGFNQDVNKELVTTNYAVPTTVRNIQEAAGGIERITVAVLVDGMVKNITGEDGKLSQEYTPRTEEEIQKYQQLVQNAIGFNTQRGDTVKIENMRFQEEDFTEAERLEAVLDRKKLIRSLFKWTLLGFSLTMFFFIVVRPFMRWITDSFQDTVEDMLPRTIEELEELQSVDNTLPGMSGALPVLEETLDPDKAESELLKERIMSIISSDNEKASGAFALWMVRKDP